MVGKRLNNKCSSDIVIGDAIIPAKSSIVINLQKYLELCNNSSALTNCINSKAIVVYNTNIDNKITISSDNTTTKNANTTNNVELQASESITENVEIVSDKKENIETEKVVDKTPTKSVTKRTRKRKNTKNK